MTPLRAAFHALTLVLMLLTLSTPAQDTTLTLTARTRIPVAGIAGLYEPRERPLDWKPAETAVIFIDVWDRHWCQGAVRRLEPLVPRMNELAKAIRSKGGLIIHAPSDTCDKFYADYPGRKLAKSAPPATPPVTMKGWCSLILDKEGPLPITDSDGGCDCEPRCKEGIVWKQEHPGIEIAAGDYISENGEEIYNVFHQRGIRNVIVAGVHTNMCILGRSFGIRRLVSCGFNVVLVRDLTDTMYNHRAAPFVPHDRGTDLVIEHVEKNWCPTILSTDILGGRKPPHIVFALDEPEYKAKETLPAFAKQELEEKLGWKVTVMASDDVKNLPNTEAIASADLLVIFMRRTTLPDEQFARFKAYFDAARPVLGIRTASHAFQNWLDFDHAILGGNYHNHFPNPLASSLSPVAAAKPHPILRGVAPLEFKSTGSLYMTTPLAKTATPLLLGTVPNQPEEPAAWTNIANGGRVFYTSLGHPDDFALPQYRKLLVNAMLWTMDRPIPANPAP
ncbi:MAG: ThuA domain-containing protein [Tepidisphaeraceae bacterium]